MVGEVSCQIAGKPLAKESDRADGSGRSIIGEDTHHIAARIAQKLQDAGFECAIVNLVPIETATIRPHCGRLSADRTGVRWQLQAAERKTGHPLVRKWRDAF
jgi:hypothetical protein